MTSFESGEAPKGKGMKELGGIRREKEDFTLVGGSWVIEERCR